MMSHLLKEHLFGRATYYKMKTDKINEMFAASLKRNDVKNAKQLLHSCGEKVNIDKPNEEGETMLHIACSKGQFEIVQLLVAAGASVNKANSRGQTSLHISASRLQADITKFLLDNGADVMLCNNDGELPLDVTSSLESALILVSKMVSLGHKDLVNDYLVPVKLAKTKQDRSEMFKCADFVESLQKESGKIKTADEGSKEQVGCRFRLAKEDKTKREQRDTGEDDDDDDEVFNQQTRRYTFPSYYGFAKQPSGSILKRSKSFSCDNEATLPEDSKLTAQKDERKSMCRTVTFPSDILCQMCIKENDYNDLKRLILNGKITDVNKLYANGITALHLAVIENKHKCAEVLIDCGADIEVQDPHGWTPLHAAVFAGNIRAVRVLCNKGADVCATTNKGETVFDLAVTDLIRKYLKMITVRLVMNEKRKM